MPRISGEINKIKTEDHPLMKYSPLRAPLRYLNQLGLFNYLAGKHSLIKLTTRSRRRLLSS